MLFQKKNVNLQPNKFKIVDNIIKDISEVNNKVSKCLDILLFQKKYVNLHSNKFKIVDIIIKDILKINNKVSKV